jgi:hypothetical protein
VWIAAPQRQTDPQTAAKGRERLASPRAECGHSLLLQLSFEHQISYLANAAYGLNLEEVNLIWKPTTHSLHAELRTRLTLSIF